MERDEEREGDSWRSLFFHRLFDVCNDFKIRIREGPWLYDRDMKRKQVCQLGS